MSKKISNNFYRRFLLIILTFVLFIFFKINLFSQELVVEKNAGVQTVKKMVNGSTISVYPVSGKNNVLHGLTSQTDNINAFNWTLKFTAGNKVFKDISFYNQNTGYIVTELGGVYKTTNGGNNWDIKMNTGFPYYWYGVHALSPDTVVIAGFNNQGNINSGVLRWTYNGGTTWTPDISISIPAGVGWLSKVHFFSSSRGIVMAEFSGGVHYTTTGGKDSVSWNYVQVNTDLGWFAGNIDAQQNGIMYATGIHLAKSTNFGVNWVSGPSADGTFDGGIDFLDNNNLKGWTGGGQISPSAAGWCHRTTDGGSLWSDRLFNFPYPIRTIKFINDGTGFAIGGNVYQDAGGIYSSINGGLNWTLDISTSAEMFALDYKQVALDSIDVWCVGSTGGATGYTGKLYKGRFGILTGIKNVNNSIPGKFVLYQNYPNPFNPKTIINYQLLMSNYVKLIIYDALGREVAVLVNQKQNAGTYEVIWNAAEISSGIYYYTLTAGEFKDTKKLVLIK
ncbi:MAG: T9SS C-terminal target domain-containing protein [Ignavibacteriae bacterium]|nr:MAG: T9SS C-terminal target domain-containing protein [Ignavibacteriota bacterium]